MSKEKSLEKIPVGLEEKLIFSSDDNGNNFTVNIGDESTKIRRSDLMGLLFLFADKRQQEDLVTMTEVKMRPIARMLKFRLNNDMKAGDVVSAVYQYLLPIDYADKLIKAQPEKYKAVGDVTIDNLAEDQIKIPL